MLRENSLWASFRAVCLCKESQALVGKIRIASFLTSVQTPLVLCLQRVCSSSILLLSFYSQQQCWLWGFWAFRASVSILIWSEARLLGLWRGSAARQPFAHQHQITPTLKEQLLISLLLTSIPVASPASEKPRVLSPGVNGCFAAGLAALLRDFLVSAQGVTLTSRWVALKVQVIPNSQAAVNWLGWQSSRNVPHSCSYMRHCSRNACGCPKEGAGGVVGHRLSPCTLRLHQAVSGAEHGPGWVLHDSPRVLSTPFVSAWLRWGFSYDQVKL